MIRILHPLTQRYDAGTKSISEITTLCVDEATALLSHLQHDLQGYLPSYPEPVGQNSGRHWRRKFCEGLP